jgi:hypothetical protein
MPLMPSMLKAVPLDVEGGFQYVRVSTYRTTTANFRSDLVFVFDSHKEWP